MSNRHIARSVVLQTLFELDREGGLPNVSGESKGQGASPDDTLVQNAAEFAPDKQLFPFMKQLLDLVLAKRKEIDDIITKAAPEWPLEKIATVDRNILRLGLSELLFADREQVPPKVAINEAIELAKEFGGDSSGRFVNGVLGAVYKELGEPGKDDSGKKKNNEENMRTEELGGAFVFARDGDGFYVALEHDIFGRWTLPKGRVEKGESIKECIVREVKEEIDLDVRADEEIGTNTYVANDPETGKYRKKVTYHMAESQFVDLKLATDKGGLDDAKWFKLTDIVELNFYDDILPIITKAVNILAQKK
jgi:N utilization substance protein B